MLLIGVEFSGSEFNFGPDHPKYWTFEAVIVPSFVFIVIGSTKAYFAREGLTGIDEAMKFGILIALVQYLLDLIFIVMLLDAGLTYFMGLVSISYVLIPLWAVVALKLARRK